MFIFKVLLLKLLTRSNLIKSLI